MNVARLIFLCTVLISPIAGVAAEPPSTTPASDAALRDLGRRWLESNAGVGLSIGIYDNGQRRFFNFGTTRIDGNTPPTKDTIYEIGPLAKTMTGQLLARAVVEGRASLDDEATKYLPDPYPNLANSGEKIRLVHLANMTSQLLDNIPDFTQVRLVPGEPLAATRMRVVEDYTQKEFLRQLHYIVPRRAPGMEPGQSNVSSMLLAVALQNIYGEPFEAIVASQIEKPLRMGSGTQPKAKLLARGYTKGNEELPAFCGPDGLFVGIAAIQHRRPAAICVLATGRTGRFGQARASADLADARQAAGRGAVLDYLGYAARTATALFRRHLWIRQPVRAVSRGESGGGAAHQQGRGRRAGVPARAVRENRRNAATLDQPPATSSCSAAGSVSDSSLSTLAATPLWFMSMRPEKWAPSAMPTRGAKMLPITLAVWRIDTDSVA